MQLYIPTLINSDLKNAYLSDKTNFFVDGKKYTGLKNHLHRKKPNKDFYLVDNHHYVFPLRYNFSFPTSEPSYPKPHYTLLIHIDQHSDMRTPPMFYDEFKKKYPNEGISEFTHKILQVGNFIIPAKKIGIFDEILQIRTEQSLLNFQKEYSDIVQSFDKIILDVDLDFRDPKMNFQNVKKTYNQVRKIIALPQVEIITIATSPYFMNQKEAINIAKKIFL